LPVQFLGRSSIVWINQVFSEAGDNQIDGGNRLAAMLGYDCGAAQRAAPGRVIDDCGTNASQAER
jgi:hypothetical protein